MDNIIKFEPQNNVLSNQEIETLFKGLIKLVEKNTEQKLKNAGVISVEKQSKTSNAKIFNFSSAIKNINNENLSQITSSNDTTSHANNCNNCKKNLNLANSSQISSNNDSASHSSSVDSLTVQNTNNLKVITELQNIKARAIKVVEENKELKQKLKTLEEKLLELRGLIINQEK